MAWDFSDDPAFGPELAWMREIVRDQIEPLDLVKAQMSRESYKSAIAPLKQQVKERGLRAGHLDPELGGQGMGQVRLALMHEILGRTPSAPEIFGSQAPDSRNGELLAVGADDELRNGVVAVIRDVEILAVGRGDFGDGVSALRVDRGAGNRADRT